MTPAEFVARWEGSGGAELANSQSFLKELCGLLGVPQPEPTQPDESQNTYVFEKAVEFNNGDGTTSSGRADLYRQGCFVLESKQGTERKAAEQAQALAEVTRARRFRTGTAARGTAAWEQAMVKARQQAKRYAEALPEWPPFLVVVDVGYCIDLYADFSQSGKNYVPFPDPRTFRLELPRLQNGEVRELLKNIWLDPLSLDPARQAAKVTRELAAKLAQLAKRLEALTDENGGKRYSPDAVAQFLMRCLFTMFAEDVPLFGDPQAKKFTRLLESLRAEPENFVPMVEALWEKMNTGGFSPIFRQHLRRFNGGLFEECTALPVDRDALELLIEAAHAQWHEVEPAIFGTLLERALDPHERHKLGAHFTPRAYVERLVMPTVIEPLRAEWDDAYAAAAALVEEAEEKIADAQQKADDLHDAGKVAQASNLLKRADREARKLRTDARKLVRDFHEQLCNVKVLDPACGSGNFLYVSLELMKRLEGEVLNTLKQFGETGERTLTVDPHQFLGIEINPRAVAIADLVLWIGYWQWHFRTRDSEPPEPIIRKFHNIECRDAVLAWDSVEPVVDEAGHPVTRWDGRTTKPHPVTGEEVPDETARVQEMRYVNPRKAEWPEADYVVGNPPFVGNSRMREALGDGYTKTLRSTFSELRESCDYVMYWWHCAAAKLKEGSIRQFGYVTTNSLKQNFNQKVISPFVGESLSLIFTIPDHPWIDDASGAAVRIAMTVATRGRHAGLLLEVTNSKARSDGEQIIATREKRGHINANLTIGVDVENVQKLCANEGLSSMGVKLHGTGFVVDEKTVDAWNVANDELLSKYVRRYLCGRDLTASERTRYAIDLFGLDENEAREKLPVVYQWVLDRVKAEREQNNRASYREKWWIFGEPRTVLRETSKGLVDIIVTPRTAKHRFFLRLPSNFILESEIVAISLSDAFFQGILSSRIHIVWALARGGRLGVGNDPRYNNSRCFDSFPFPDANDAAKARIRALGEQLDAHRKRQQQLHPTLTMTGMYNVLEKLRAGEELTAKEKQIHEQGLVSVLLQIHDDLDAAVADAYGWPHDLTDEEILERLVALNHERAAEEAAGKIRWLRPEFQCAGEDAQRQTELEIEQQQPRAKPAAAAKKKEPLPKALPERIRAIRTALADEPAAVDAAALARRFSRANTQTVEELLETLIAVGQARRTDDGRYVA